MMRSGDIDKSICTGCGACEHFCPMGGISLSEDHEGFLYPLINHACTNCGLCLKKCPAVNPVYTNFDQPGCFAARASDELRMGGSSSGGVFPVLAKHILGQGGLVCGAAYRADFSGAEHIIVDNCNDLHRLMGSKYLQSDCRNSYRLIKGYLAEGRPCLFAGTPCQVAGLYALLGTKHDKLLTVDLICHGVPPARVFRKYLADCFSGEHIESIDFRDKSHGWGPKLNVKIITDRETYLADSSRDPYLRMFLNDLALRPSCAHCQFNKIPRQADLSLGDFWGFERFDKKRKLDDGKGLSLVMVNNLGGHSFIDEIKDHFLDFKKAPLKIAIRGNSIIEHPAKRHRNSKYFFETLETETFSDNLERNLDGRCDALIFNFWFGNNYGAILTSYALAELLQKHGLRPQFVDYCPNDRPPGGIAANFAEKYFQVTPPCRNNNDLAALNRLTDTFIVGSDQVWRRNYNQDYHYAFFLDFVDYKKKKIACSASFGLGRFDLNASLETRLRHLIKQFDHISVREDDGVAICQNTFGVKAEHLLDPVFALNGDHYGLLAEKSARNESEHIFSYCLSTDEKMRAGYRRAESFLAEKLGAECLHVGLNQDQVSVEDWLYLIKNSKFIFTDSFHGVCFAIIFNKPFMAVDHKLGGSSRYKSLFRTFGIANRLLTDPDDLRHMDLFGAGLDYSRINEIIKHEKGKFDQWLTKALDSKKILSETAADEQLRYLTGRIADLEELGLLLAQKNKIYLKYYRYKLLSLISRGAKKEKYREKRQRYKAAVNRLRLLTFRVGLTAGTKL